MLLMKPKQWVLVTKPQAVITRSSDGAFFVNTDMILKAVTKPQAVITRSSYGINCNGWYRTKTSQNRKRSSQGRAWMAEEGPLSEEYDGHKTASGHHKVEVMPSVAASCSNLVESQNRKRSSQGRA